MTSPTQRRVLLFVTVLLLSMLSKSVLAAAQASPPTTQTAEVTLTAVDAGGLAVQGAKITLGGAKNTTGTTTADGSIPISLPYGSYVAIISHSCFENTEVRFEVGNGHPPQLRFVLGYVIEDCGGLPPWIPHPSPVELPITLRTGLALPLFALKPPAAKHCPKNQSKTEAALIDLEHHWADALTRKDADAVACILAQEFEDADVDGSVHSRTEALARIPQRKPWTNRLTDMHAHVEGNFGFTRGLNEILDADGKVVARVRFTDIFTYRDGRWQALAGQETLVGEAHR